MVFQNRDMSENRRPLTGIRWRWGLIAAAAMALVSLWPQFDLWFNRGTEWNGAFAHSNHDEDIYAAYINGLIAGRPRVSDPLIENRIGESPPESLFSIQFVQPMLLSYTARALGLSTSTVFVLLCPFIAFLSTIALFLLAFEFRRDEFVAAATALFVLAFGTLASFGGKVLALLHLGNYTHGLMFLRRYQPGISFALFFVFMLLVWTSIRSEGRTGRRTALMASAVFVLLVFSYFFIWTAALAWLVIFVSLWTLTRPFEMRKLIGRVLPIALIGGGALAIYAAMLVQIATNTSETQALEYTRALDLKHFPLFIGTAAIVMILHGIRSGKRPLNDPHALLGLSLAALPLLLFNQQVVTGISLQPIHYDFFIGNYVSLLSLAFAFQIRSEPVSRPRVLPSRTRSATVLAIVSLVIACVEVNYDRRKRSHYNLQFDRFAEVADKLRNPDSVSSAVPYDREVVFSSQLDVVSDTLATIAPQAVLWSKHAKLSPNSSPSMARNRFYLQLYYSGVTPDILSKKLIGNDIYSVTALFGFERWIPGFVSKFEPIREEEIRSAAEEYEEFIIDISSATAMDPILSWAVIPTDETVDLSNLDRWYERVWEEQIGGYRLIRLEPRVLPEAEPSGLK